jgi:hypothetical protein
MPLMDAETRHLFRAVPQTRRNSCPETLLAAVTKVFPWSWHLGREHTYEFARELTAALSDAAELDNDAIVQEVIAGWKATARIMADPELYAEALRIGRARATPG